MGGVVVVRQRLAADRKPDIQYRAVGRVATHEKPCAAAVDMLPVLRAHREPVDAQIDAIADIAAGLGKRLAEAEFLQLPCAAERTIEPGQWRTGNGPNLRSFNRCPL